ncbi:MAG TPA: hypothetical protein VFI62_11480 [Burkholderiales bacterium]|nr:hypothetical protein [Burkholderiales bacterium]
MIPPLDARQLRKRMLMFYFAAGVNLLMAFWVFSVGAQAASGSFTTVMLVFLGFAGVNYYMARKLNKQLNRMQSGAPPQNTGGDGTTT